MNLIPDSAARKRIARWIESAKPVDIVPSWTETRQAIDYGGHTYIVNNGQVFQCAHCGSFDPEWNASEVLNFFKEVLDIKPYEIEVTCTVTVKEK